MSTHGGVTPPRSSARKGVQRATRSPLRERGEEITQEEFTQHAEYNQRIALEKKFKGR